jgi:hypothetical protein
MRKLRMVRSLAGAALLMGIWAGPASAELVSQDLLATGDGLITLDTSSGAQWLDFSLTRGLSLEEVLALDLVSAQGFRLASEEQVRGMWREAGVTLVGDFPNYASVAQTNRLHALFGTTGARAGYGDSDGDGPYYIATDGSAGRLYQGSFGTPSSLSFYALLAVSDDGVAAYANLIGGSLPSRDPSLAWYMVKPVPLPASFWLLASAAGLLGLRRGSTRAQHGIGRSGR